MPCSSALDCYMNDVVNCLEDFVKKSLIIISVAVGSLLLALLYIVKLLSERVKPSGNGATATNTVACAASNPSQKCSIDGDCSNLTKKTSHVSINEPQADDDSDIKKKKCIEKAFSCCYKSPSSENIKGINKDSKLKK